MSGWGLHPRMIEGELLSSYFLRIAKVQGCLPHTFCAIHLPGHSIWSRDIDRNPPLGLVQAVAKKEGVSTETIEMMTFRRMASVFGETSGVIPWVMPVGIWHRKRKAYGLQFCPVCLAETPAYYQRHWRLAFLTHCHKHGVRLLKGCSFCGEALAPHRSAANQMFHCHACGRLLASASKGILMSGQLSKLQQQLLSAFQGDSVVLERELIPGDDWLKGCRPLLTLVICRKLGKQGKSFERSAVEMRLRALSALESWLENWPERFLSDCGRLGITQRSFARVKDCPLWLNRQISTLPLGESRVHRPKWQLLDFSATRRSGEGWRQRRAAAILEKVTGL